MTEIHERGGGSSLDRPDCPTLSASPIIASLACIRVFESGTSPPRWKVVNGRGLRIICAALTIHACILCIRW